MLPGPRTLHLAPSWSSEGEVVLASWPDAHQLSREGWETLPREEALRCFDRVGPQIASPLRRFIAGNHLAGSDLRGLHDHAILGLLRACMRREEVAVVRARRSTAPNEARELRHLIAQIERESRGRLTYRGRQYKLTLGDDLAAIPDRNSYEVVPQAEARAILDKISSDVTTLGASLAKAKEKLSKDWRPPFSQPDGLVLLRRMPITASKPNDDGPAITPVQMRKLLKSEWIEIEVVDQDGEPYTGHYFVELPDESSVEGDLGEEALYGNYSLNPGNCTLHLGNIATGSASGTEAPPPPATTAVPETVDAQEPDDVADSDAPELDEQPSFEDVDEQPCKVRLRLLDLAGRPISGAEVAVAGTPLTTDADGMVEADVLAADNVPATLPGGEAGLHVGGLASEGEEVTGWSTRLYNMGFLWDPGADPESDEMAMALEDFRAQHGVAVTGPLDDETKAKLVEVYGC